jgi:hypothetical protein
MDGVELLDSGVRPMPQEIFDPYLIDVDDLLQPTAGGSVEVDACPRGPEPQTGVASCAGGFEQDLGVRDVRRNSHEVRDARRSDCMASLGEASTVL